MRRSRKSIHYDFDALPVGLVADLHRQRLTGAVLDGDAQVYDLRHFPPAWMTTFCSFYSTIGAGGSNDAPVDMPADGPVDTRPAQSLRCEQQDETPADRTAP